MSDLAVRFAGVGKRYPHFTLEDIDLAKEDCLSAVVADLVAKKIIPTIKIKAGL